jgi:hypothetical protein
MFSGYNKKREKEMNEGINKKREKEIMKKGNLCSSIA